jgi:putative transposase
MNAHDVLDALHPLLMKHGKPAFIRSDNGPKFISLHLQDWLKRVGIQPLQIYPGSPWKMGITNASTGHLDEKCSTRNGFTPPNKLRSQSMPGSRQYNQIKPHHALNMKPPVPETLLEKTKISGTETWG